MLTFNAALHEYRWDGVRVPSVTQVLQIVQDYSMVDPDVLLAAQQRGTAVHRMTELFDQDDLDEDFLEIEMHAYLQAYKAFLRDTRFTATIIEKQLYHPKLRYSGTPDRAGLLRQRRAVIDIKSMFTPGAPVIGLQLAGYGGLLDMNGTPIEDRYALHLRRDGTYRLHPYTDHDDWTVFLSLLNVSNWRNKYGI